MMLSLKTMLCWLALSVFVAIATVPLAEAQEAQGSSQELSTSLKNFLQRMDTRQDTRYVAAFKDLNGDGKPEAIVHLIGDYWCGSGGCTTLVLAREGDSWKTVTKITISRAPIRLLPRRSHGWASIAVWVQGGGILRGREVELRFDGKTYPANPSLLPAQRHRLRGEIVVHTWQTGERLND